MTDQDIEDLKKSRPPGPGWEWCRDDKNGYGFYWRLTDQKQDRICFIGLAEKSWFADVESPNGILLYRTEFASKEAMQNWAREFSSFKVRRSIQENHKYYARPIEAVKHGKGYWDTYKIGIFRRNPDGDELIGQYDRNYSFLDTFHWFTKDGKDYALYSKDYTATRIMELPSCKDLGGEDPLGHGFCPVEFYVPSYVQREIVDENPKFNGTQYRVYEPTDAEINDRDGSKATSTVVHEPFGFVAGCVWGDDTSWKVQFLDLSEADKGIIKRDDRFGYIELPRELTLREAIDAEGEESIRIAHEQYFNKKTGQRSDCDLRYIKQILARAGMKKIEEIDQKAAYPLSMKGEDYKEIVKILGNPEEDD